MGGPNQELMASSVKWTFIDRSYKPKRTIDHEQDVSDLAVALDILRMESLALPEAQAVLSVLALQVLINFD